jgi:hypothetical protein
VFGIKLLFTAVFDMTGQFLQGYLMANELSHLRTMVNQDGAAILDTKLGQISTLNTTGAYVWQALERGEAMQTIVASLVRETDEEVALVEMTCMNSLKR